MSDAERASLSPTSLGETLSTTRQAKHDATMEAEPVAKSGSLLEKKAVPVNLRGVKLARSASAAAQNSMLQFVDSVDIEQTAAQGESQLLRDTHAMREQSPGRASNEKSQLWHVLDEIEDELYEKAERQRKDVSHVEVLSVQMENVSVMESEEVQRRLRVRGKMVDELHAEVDQMRQTLIRVHGSRISEMEAKNTSRFVDYPALERRLETAEKTLHRLALECPSLEAQMPAIARGIEEFEDRRRETDRLLQSCWESAQGALDKYSQELCAEFDRALAPSTANLEALRAEMARCQQELEVLKKPDAQRPRTGLSSRSRRSTDGQMSRPQSATLSYDGRHGTGGQNDQPSWSNPRLQQRRPVSASGALSTRRGRGLGLSHGDAYRQQRHRRGTDPDQPPRLLSRYQQSSHGHSSVDCTSAGRGGNSGEAVAPARPASAGPRLPKHTPRQALPAASR
eukprot:COSAG02_NODE_1863_length_10608_cov_128.518508_5_plen_454_part_00